MCDRFRLDYLTQPPRAGPQIMLQRGILFWKYNLMRSLILPILGIEKAIFDTESQLWGCRGSQILETIYQNQVPSIMREWKFLSAVAVEEDRRCSATSMIQGEVVEPSFVVVNPDLLAIRRCQRVSARDR